MAARIITPLELTSPYIWTIDIYGYYHYWGGDIETLIARLVPNYKKENGKPVYSKNYWKVDDRHVNKNNVKEVFKQIGLHEFPYGSEYTHEEAAELINALKKDKRLTVKFVFEPAPFGSSGYGRHQKWMKEQKQIQKTSAKTTNTKTKQIKKATPAKTQTQSNVSALKTLISNANYIDFIKGRPTIYFVRGATALIGDGSHGDVAVFRPGNKNTQWMRMSSNGHIIKKQNLTNTDIYDEIIKLTSDNTSVARFVSRNGTANRGQSQPTILGIWGQGK